MVSYTIIKILLDERFTYPQIKHSLYQSCILIFRYFEDEEEDSSNVDLPYIPAENSPTRQQFHSKPVDSDSDDDPLEAFMAEVEASINSVMLTFLAIRNRSN